MKQKLQPNATLNQKNNNRITEAFIPYFLPFQPIKNTPKSTRAVPNN
jgi:hypothetical protein